MGLLRGALQEGGEGTKPGDIGVSMCFAVPPPVSSPHPQLSHFLFLLFVILLQGVTEKEKKCKLRVLVSWIEFT